MTGGRNELGHWLPGQSGNPRGKPATPPEVKLMLGVLTEDAVRALADALHSDDERVRVTAAVQVLDRVLGKPAPAGATEAGGTAQAHIAALNALANLTNLAANAADEHQPVLLAPEHGSQQTPSDQTNNGEDEE